MSNKHIIYCTPTDYKLISIALEWISKENSVSIQDLIGILKSNNNMYLYRFEMLNLAPLGSQLQGEDSASYRDIFLEDFCSPWYESLLREIERFKKNPSEYLG